MRSTDQLGGLGWPLGEDGAATQPVDADERDVIDARSEHLADEAQTGLRSAVEGDEVDAVVLDHLLHLGHGAGVVRRAGVDGHPADVGAALLLHRLLDVEVPLITRGHLELGDRDDGVLDGPELLADVGDGDVSLVTVVGDVVVDVGHVQLGVDGLGRADDRDPGAGDVRDQRGADVGPAHLDDGEDR